MNELIKEDNIGTMIYEIRGQQVKRLLWFLQGRKFRPWKIRIVEEDIILSTCLRFLQSMALLLYEVNNVLWYNLVGVIIWTNLWM